MQGRDGGGRVADVLLVDRDVAPAEDALALDADVHLEQLLDLLAARRVVGQEALRHAVGAQRREVEVDDRAQERVGHADEDPGAVARADVGALGAAVLEIVERHQRAVDDLVRRPVVQPRHHRHATGIVLEPRVVEAVGLWRLVAQGHKTLPWSAARGARGRSGKRSERSRATMNPRVGVCAPEH